MSRNRNRAQIGAEASRAQDALDNPEPATPVATPEPATPVATRRHLAGDASTEAQALVMLEVAATLDAEQAATPEPPFVEVDATGTEVPFVDPQEATPVNPIVDATPDTDTTSTPPVVEPVVEPVAPLLSGSPHDATPQEATLLPAPFTLTLQRRVYVAAENLPGLSLALLSRESGASLTFSLATPESESELHSHLVTLESRLYPIRRDASVPQPATLGIWWDARQHINTLRQRNPALGPLLSRTSGASNTPGIATPATPAATRAALESQIATLESRIATLRASVASNPDAEPSSATPPAEVASAT